MTFNVYYKIKDKKLIYVGLAKVDDVRTISFQSYESCIIFEDKLLRLMHNNESVTHKKIKKLCREVQR